MPNPWESFSVLQSTMWLPLTHLCFVHRGNQGTPLSRAVVIFRITCYYRKMRREPNRAPSGPSPRFHCCPWHCPSNLQTIKQTPSPAHYQTGTSSHRGLGLEAGKLRPFLQCPDASSGAWRGRWSYWTLSDSPDAGTSTASRRCGSASESWDSQAWKRPSCNLQTAKKKTSFGCWEEACVFGSGGWGKKCP